MSIFKVSGTKLVINLQSIGYMRENGLSFSHLANSRSDSIAIAHLLNSVKMDFFFDKKIQKTLSLLTETEIKRITLDRIFLMHLCRYIVQKLKNDAKPQLQNLRALVIFELVVRNKTALKYLIGEDDQLELSKEQIEKIYFSWFLLMSASVLIPKWQDWIREQEANLMAVFITRLDRHIQEDCCKSALKAVDFKFASAEEVHTFQACLDPSKTYVKIHLSVISIKLMKEGDDFNFIHNGFYFVEYERNLVDLISCAIECEWEKNWHEYFWKRDELMRILKKEETVKDIENALSQSIEERVIARSFQEMQVPMKLPNLADMAQKFFPPCMSSMLAAFNHHGELKHDARKQLTLFLKDIGMPIEDIINLYEKNYSRPSLIAKRENVMYFMRHLLGLVNLSVNYKSYNCQQIQDHSGNGIQLHGCYFKNISITELNVDMQKLNFCPARKRVIAKTLRTGGCTAACKLHLQERFNLKELPQDMEKPNDYFYMARCAKPCNRELDIEDFISSDDDEMLSQCLDCTVKDEAITTTMKK